MKLKVHQAMPVVEECLSRALEEAVGDGMSPAAIEGIKSRFMARLVEGSHQQERALEEAGLLA